LLRFWRSVALSLRLFSTHRVRGGIAWARYRPRKCKSSRAAWTRVPSRRSSVPGVPEHAVQSHSQQPVGCRSPQSVAGPATEGDHGHSDRQPRRRHHERHALAQPLAHRPEAEPTGSRDGARGYAAYLPVGPGVTTALPTIALAYPLKTKSGALNGAFIVESEVSPTSQFNKRSLRCPARDTHGSPSSTATATVLASNNNSVIGKPLDESLLGTKTGLLRGHGDVVGRGSRAGRELAGCVPAADARLRGQA